MRPVPLSVLLFRDAQFLHQHVVLGRREKCRRGVLAVPFVLLLPGEAKLLRGSLVLGGCKRRRMRSVPRIVFIGCGVFLCLSHFGGLLSFHSQVKIDCQGGQQNRVMFLLWRVKFFQGPRWGLTTSEMLRAVEDLTIPQVSEHNSDAQDR